MELMLKDRLTHHINDEVTTNAFMGDVLYQLARYEDTGFSVEELESLREKRLQEDVSVPHVTAESYEEICLAENEGRLIILKYKVGQTIYAADYASGENFLSPIPLFLESPVVVLQIMYDDSKEWFESLTKCQEYCDIMNNQI